MTQAFIECSCPDGHTLNVGQHHPECQLADIDGNVACPPGSSCCQEAHDHAAAANACPGGHDSAACPDPAGTCRVWAGITANTRHPDYQGEAPGPCPGGHCAKGVAGCTVCRPLIITVLPGTTIAMAAGG